MVFWHTEMYGISDCILKDLNNWNGLTEQRKSYLINHYAIEVKRGEGADKKETAEILISSNTGIFRNEAVYGVYSKIEEIRDNPNRYKNLKSPLHHLKRVHIDKSFVMVFSVDENKKLVIIEDYDHHDNIYK